MDLKMSVTAGKIAIIMVTNNQAENLAIFILVIMCILTVLVNAGIIQCIKIIFLGAFLLASICGSLYVLDSE